MIRLATPQRTVIPAKVVRALEQSADSGSRP